MCKKLTTEEFIDKARKVHGDKYDYSKVEYVKSQTPVCIICPEHGEFWQKPNIHLSGCGCSKCGGSTKLTTEEFIDKARKVHGDKYDYSKVEYINNQTPVCIICPEHGEFWNTPNHHLNGQGCSKCCNNKKGTINEFIKKARKIHGDKYDYSKAEYINRKTRICIICPEHGEFWQRPYGHLYGSGCPKCVGKHKPTTEEFITKAREVHGDKYDYSKVEYVNSKTPVCIICPEHGEFWQRPNNHLSGSGCDKCGGTYKWTREEFIAKAREVHGDKYDYSKVEYVDGTTPVRIICPEHGEFKQKPFVHLLGCGCSKCGYIKVSNKLKFSTEEFIAKAREVHGDKYDYSMVEYVNYTTKVCIICPEHGKFEQNPSDHLSGHGCPNCTGIRKEYKFNLLQEFKDEYKFRAFLEKNDINLLYVLLMNIDSKFDPIKKDIEKALLNASEADPIQVLEDKYKSDNDEEDETEEANPNTDLNNIDWDDAEAVNKAINTTVKTNNNTNKQPTIEDLMNYTEQEIKVFNKVEHMLIPEVREYIMKKFLNDKRRLWITNREK